MNVDARLLRQAKSKRWLLYLTIGLGFAAGIVTVLQARVISQIVAGVYLEGLDLRQVTPYLAFLLGIFSLRAGLTWGSEISAQRIARQVKTNLRVQLYEHLLSLGPSFRQNESTGELVGAIQEGIEALDAYYSQYLPQLALAALVPLTYLFFVFPVDWLSGLVLLLTAPLIPIFMILIGSAAQSLTRRQWLALSRMKAYFLDVLQGLTTLKIFGRSQTQVGRVAEVSNLYRQTTMKVLRVTFLSALVLEMVATISTAILAVQIGLRLLYTDLSFEPAFFLLLLAPEFYLPLRLLGTRFHAGMAGVEAAQRIFTLLETSPRQVQNSGPSNPWQTGEIPTRNTSDSHIDATLSINHPPTIQFSEVCFSYPNHPGTLDSVSFLLSAGQKTALVGPSGAGKSTLANLVLKFIEPDLGDIYINNFLLRDLDPAAWRQRVAWVSQQPYLFHASIADNIRLAKPSADMGQVIQAARLAHADEFIDRLPQGYETTISEKGANLSAGQAQRIALARAFLKDAPLIILDEATANLDPETESLIQDSVSHLLRNRTALIIAHRLNTTIQADQILVLDQGKIIQRGNHQNLVSKAGLYQDLFQAYQSDFIQAGLPTNIHPESQSPSTLNLGDLAVRDLSSSIPDESLPEKYAWQTAPHLTGQFRVLTRLLALIAPFKSQIFLSALVGMATSLSGIGLLGTSAYLISAAALAPSIAELQVAIVGVRFFGIARGVFRYLERLISHDTTFRILARLRTNFFQALEPLAPARLQQFRSGDLLERITGDIDTLENFYVRATAPPIVAIGVGIFAFGILYYMTSLWPALAWLIIYLVAGAGIPITGRWLSSSPGKKLSAQRSMLSNILIDGIQGMPDVLANSAEKRQITQLDKVQEDYAETQEHLHRIGAVQNSLLGLSTNLGMWVVLILTIPLITSGRLEGVYLAVVALIALTSFEAIQPLPVAAQFLESNLAAAHRLFQVIDASPEIVDPPQPLPIPQELHLSAKQLTFSYPAFASPASRNLVENPGILLDSSSPDRSYATPEAQPITLSQALTGISFDLQQGKKLGLVGSSGSGKSTLVNLLLRFWEYQSGSLTLAGQDIRCYASSDIRSLMGVVSQDAFLFRATLRDNLRLANPRASSEDIERACASAQILEDILALPEQFDTWVGEQGLTLSAGQRQRIAIARAVLKKSPILLLDEPTANLDPITEQAIIEVLYSLLHARSVLWITHRLTGMEWMDEILVLRSGVIVERGRHHQLLENQGYYWRMYLLQNQLFKLG